MGDHRDQHRRTHSFPTRLSSDLLVTSAMRLPGGGCCDLLRRWKLGKAYGALSGSLGVGVVWLAGDPVQPAGFLVDTGVLPLFGEPGLYGGLRSEEHTSELQSLMRISYAVFCLKKKKPNES